MAVFRISSIPIKVSGIFRKLVFQSFLLRGVVRSYKFTFLNVVFIDIKRVWTRGDGVGVGWLKVKIGLGVGVEG